MTRKSLTLLMLLLIIIGVYGQNKDYSFYLKSGLEQPNENMKELTKLEPVFQGVRTWEGNYYCILQFYKLPDKNMKKYLAEMHIVFEDYVPNNAFLVSLPKDIDVSLLKKAGARNITPFLPKFKIAPTLTEITRVPDEAWADGNNINLILIYHNDISPDDFKADLKSKLNVTINRIDEKYQTIEITIPFSEIRTLASLPYVKYIEDNSYNLTVDDRYVEAHHGLSYVRSPEHYNLQGDSITVAMSDVSSPAENIDFKGRLNDDDYPDFYVQGYHNHGDHTSGIVASAGNFNEIYKGVAPKANLIVFRSDGATEAADNNSDIVITSTSLGTGIKSCSTYGRYNNRSRTEDQRINQLPYLLECWSAGNEAPSCYPGESRMFGLNEGEASAKNTLAVGGYYDRWPQGRDVYKNNSSRGPTADRRIKPEIIALGKVVSNLNFNRYGKKMGSSQATPAVAGTAALLYELYRDKHNGENPDAALIKAVLCNTAIDCASRTDNSLENPNPDFSSGFGYMDGYRAIQAIDSSWYAFYSMDNNDEKEMTITVPQEIGKLKIMICWNDPAAAAFAEHSLVNDIDLEVYNPEDSLFQPWVLDTTPGHFQDLAVRGVDNINNIEQVTIDNPDAGNYRIKLKGTNVPSGPQKVWVTYFMLKKEVCIITNPMKGASYFPGEKKIPISYETNKDAHWGGGFLLKITYDGGETWQTLTSDNYNYGPSQLYYLESIPMGIQTGKARIYVKFNHASDTSDYFSIMDIPANLRAEYSQNGNTSLVWDNIQGAIKYEVFKLGEKYMESIGTTTTNSFLATGIDHSEDNYFAVRAYGPDEAISRRSKPVFVPSGEFGSSDMIVSEYPFKESFEGPWNTSYFGSFRHVESFDEGGDLMFSKGALNAGYTDSGPSRASDHNYYAYIFKELDIDFSGYNQPYCLESPVFDFSNLEKPSVSFDYNMHGETMGSLYLLISDIEEDTWDTLFGKSGEQGDRWFKEKIMLPQYQGKSVQFRIVGISGNSYNSEMAVDNFIVDDEDPISADFYTFKRIIQSGDTVDFHDLSSDNSTSRIWVFEGANIDTSYEKDPVVVYNTPGMYKVELTSTNQYGADTKIKRGYISVGDDDYYCLPDDIVEYNLWIGELQLLDDTINYPLKSYFNSSDLTTHLHTGENEITVILNYRYSRENKYIKFWIDLDKDGALERDELVLTEGPTMDDTVSCTLNIPYGITNLVTRMRISVLDYSGSGTIPCQSGYSGDIYDYNVIIDTIPSAGFLADTTEIDVGESIAFTDNSTNNTTSWLWDFEKNGEHIYSTAKNPVITFNEAGIYSVKMIASNYFGSDTVTMTDYITVSSSCRVNGFPYTEGFENDGSIPDCWSVEYVTDTQDWDFRKGSPRNNPSNAHTGNYNACLYNPSSQANVTKLITPELNLANVENPTLSFWHTQKYWSPDQDYLKLYYKIHPDSSWVLIKEWTENVSDWTQEELPLPDISSHYFIAFEGWAQYGYGVCIDDVKIEQGSADPPDCTNPVSPADGVDDVSISSNLVWESASNTVGYKLYLGTDNPPTNMVNGTDLGNVTQYDPANDFDYTTTYYWKIIPYNNNGDATGCSVWTFTTSSTCSYCNTSYSNTTDDYITRVVFNQIDKTSGSTNYSDFTSISTDIDQGQTYTLSVDVKVNGSWVQKAKAWIDWNQNCVLDDDGEEYVVGETPGQQGTFTLSTEIAVPADAQTGSTRLRIAERYSVYPSPCTSVAYGEAEDYTVNVNGSRSLMGIDETALGNVVIYPNPVNNNVFYVKSDQRINSIYIYDLKGTCVLTAKELGERTVKLNIADLSRGIYFIKVVTKAHLNTLQLIKQ